MPGFSDAHEFRVDLSLKFDVSSRDSPQLPTFNILAIKCRMKFPQRERGRSCVYLKLIKKPRGFRIYFIAPAREKLSEPHGESFHF